MIDINRFSNIDELWIHPHAARSQNFLYVDFVMNGKKLCYVACKKLSGSGVRELERQLNGFELASRKASLCLNFDQVTHQAELLKALSVAHQVSADAYSRRVIQLSVASA
jgi:hypothetical protein